MCLHKDNFHRKCKILYLSAEPADFFSSRLRRSPHIMELPAKNSLVHRPHLKHCAPFFWPKAFQMTVLQQIIK